jgi:DNA primase
LATGGRISFDKIVPYLSSAFKVLLAHDNDKAGDEQANNIAKNVTLKTERLRPTNNLKDWNEVLKYNISKQIYNDRHF